MARSYERNVLHVIYINSIEVLRRRNKSGSQCIPNYRYDDVIIRQEIEKVGCKPPYYHSNEDFPICKKPEELEYFVQTKNKLAENHIPPCHGMSHVFYKHHKEIKDSHQVIIEYPKHVKEISQEQKIDQHALIGNIGGYIGLFLGKI